MMVTDPFENQNSSGNPFENQKKSKKGKRLIVTLIVIIVVVGLGILLYNKIQQKIAKVKLHDAYTAVIEEGGTEEFLKNSGMISPTFVADSSLLGSGSEIILSPDNTTEKKDTPMFLEEGYDYRYDDVIEPGVYTLEYVSGENVGFASKNGLVVTGYDFGPEQEGSVMKNFSNVPITAEDEMFAYATDDFELKLTPQTEYVEFDQNNIVPGVYTAGENIEPGTYELSSKSADAVNIGTTLDGETKIVSSDDVTEVKLEKGDTVIIDSADTSFELNE